MAVRLVSSIPSRSKAMSAAGAARSSSEHAAPALAAAPPPPPGPVHRPYPTDHKDAAGRPGHRVRPGPGQARRDQVRHQHVRATPARTTRAGRLPPRERRSARACSPHRPDRRSRPAPSGLAAPQHQCPARLSGSQPSVHSPLYLSNSALLLSAVPACQND